MMHGSADMNTAQFINRAKHAALTQAGSNLANLFGLNNGPQMGCQMSGPHPGPHHIDLPGPHASNNGGPMMGPGNMGMMNGGGQMSSNGPMPGGTFTFTSQLSGIPIPDHPSGAFPTFDCIMVPAGCGQGQQGSPSPGRGMLGGVGGGSENGSGLHNSMMMNSFTGGGQAPMPSGGGQQGPMSGFPNMINLGHPLPGGYISGGSVGTNGYMGPMLGSGAPQMQPLNQMGLMGSVGLMGGGESGSGRMRNLF
ncbi:unnamed protein product [Protopolystoma xenopodis]|uniref:Uncharacterized protein n=1 Tax=Protopolystoma xenopodis TaxID=117903 RepID=A0A3S5CHH6_9PLAT|nr:unnamed protein product [Protopolystoma xenopodis]